MADLVAAAATAKRLIDANGRAVTLLHLGNAPLDTDKPHRGQAVPTRAEVTGNAVFVPESIFAEREGEAGKRGLQFALFAADDDAGYSLEEFNELVEADGTTWRIANTRLLDPGTPRILYQFRVER